MFDQRTTFERVARGAKNLENAARIMASDVRIGDRLLARGVVDVSGNRIAARSVFVKATASKNAS